MERFLINQDQNDDTYYLTCWFDLNNHFVVTEHIQHKETAIELKTTLTRKYQYLIEHCTNIRMINDVLVLIRESIWKQIQIKKLITSLKDVVNDKNEFEKILKKCEIENLVIEEYVEKGVNF